MDIKNIIAFHTSLNKPLTDEEIFWLYEKLIDISKTQPLCELRYIDNKNLLQLHQKLINDHFKIKLFPTLDLNTRGFLGANQNVFIKEEDKLTAQFRKMTNAIDYSLVVLNDSKDTDLFFEMSKKINVPNIIGFKDGKEFQWPDITDGSYLSRVKNYFTLD